MILYVKYHVSYKMSKFVIFIDNVGLPDEKTYHILCKMSKFIIFY